MTGGKDNKFKRQPQEHEDEDMFLDFAEDYLPIVPVTLKELKFIDKYDAELQEKRNQLKRKLKIKENIALLN